MGPGGVCEQRGHGGGHEQDRRRHGLRAPVESGDQQALGDDAGVDEEVSARGRRDVVVDEHARHT